MLKLPRLFRTKRHAQPTGQALAALYPAQPTELCSLHAPLSTDLFFAKGQGVAVRHQRADTFAPTVEDFEGITRMCKVGEVRFYGRRRVQNLLVDSEDFSRWDKYINGTGVTPVVSDGVGTSPCGTGCKSIVLNRGVGTNSSDFSGIYQYIAPSQVANRVLCYSVYVKAATASDVGRHVQIGMNWSLTTVTLTADWQRYMHTFSASGSGDFAQLYAQGHVSEVSVNVLFAAAQVEDVTNQSIQEAGNYVPTGLPCTSWGPNLLTNGSFASDLSGWTKESSGVPCESMWANGVLRMSRNDSASTAKSVYQAFATTPGRTYQLSFSIPQKTASAFARVGTAATGYDTLETGFLSAGQYVVTFVATTSTHYLSLFIYTGNAGDYVEWDDVSVKEAQWYGACVDGVRYFDTDIDGKPLRWKRFVPEGTAQEVLMSANMTDSTVWVSSNGCSATYDGKLLDSGRHYRVEKTSTSMYAQRVVYFGSLPAGWYTTTISVLASENCNQCEVGIYSAATAWGSDPNVSVTKVSGPATVVAYGSLAGLTNLSTTIPTVLTLRRYITASEGLYIIIYPDTTVSTTSGRAAYVAVIGEEYKGGGLLVEGAATQLVYATDITNSGYWGSSTGITRTSDGSRFKGVPFYLVTRTDTTAIASATTGLNAGSVVPAGWYVSRMAFMGTGSCTQLTFGLYQSSAGWGSDVNSTCSVVSGPGVLTRVTGSLWWLSGLSTSIPTVVELKLNVTASQYLNINLYPDTHNSVTAGRAVYAAVYSAEAGSIASSAILSAAGVTGIVTRPDDVPSLPTAGNLNADSGGCSSTVTLPSRAINGISRMTGVIFNGQSTWLPYVYENTTITTYCNVYAYVHGSGAASSALGHSNAQTPGEVLRVACSWRMQSAVNVAANGRATPVDAGATGTAGLQIVPASVTIGIESSGNYALNGAIRDLKLYGLDLTTAQLQAATT